MPIRKGGKAGKQSKTVPRYQSISPTEPTIVSVVNSGFTYFSGQFTITFTPPTYGALPTSYTITATSSSYGTKTFSGVTSSPFIATGLRGGTNYTWRIKANHTSYGDSNERDGGSSESLTVPDAPTAVTASSPEGTSYDSVSWLAPADNGGAAITNYEITSSDGKTVYTSGTSININQEGGTAQTYRVRAYNSKGWSELSSASGSVTTFSFTPFGVFSFAPFGVFSFTPAPPSLNVTNLSGTATGTTTATISWSSNAQESFLLMVVPRFSDNEPGFTLRGTTSTSVTATGLTPDNDHDITLWVYSGPSQTGSSALAQGLVRTNAATPIVLDKTVPNVVGLTSAAATTAITAEGLSVDGVQTGTTTSLPANSGKVQSQSPAAGTAVASGTGVLLTMWNYVAAGCTVDTTYTYNWGEWGVCGATTTAKQRRQAQSRDYSTTNADCSITTGTEYYHNAGLPAPWSELRDCIASCTPGTTYEYQWSDWTTCSGGTQSRTATHRLNVYTYSDCSTDDGLEAYWQAGRSGPWTESQSCTVAFSFAPVFSFTPEAAFSFAPEAFSVFSFAPAAFSVFSFIPNENAFSFTPAAVSCTPNCVFDDYVCNGYGATYYYVDLNNCGPCATYSDDYGCA